MSPDPRADARTVLDTVLIRAGTLEVTRGQVLHWAERFDPGHAARVRRRRELGALDEALLEDEVESATDEFRYDRDLEVVEALTAWLAERGLTLGGWHEAIRRNVLASHFAGVSLMQDPDPDGDDPRGVNEGGEAAGDEDMEEVDGEDLDDRQVEEDDGDDGGEGDEEWLADLVLSDLLAVPTRALSHRLAVALAGGASPAGVAFELWCESIESAWEAWRAPLLTEAALAAAVARERLIWLVLGLTETRWPSADAAREAMACVRFDGADLGELAESSGVLVLTGTRLLADTPPSQRDALAAAVAGEIVGPFESAAGWSVVQVLEKHPPALAHPLVRAAAEAALEARAVAPLVERHITYLLPTG